MKRTFEQWRAMSQKDLALAHLRGEDLSDAWWAIHWTWESSAEYRWLCRADEALQLLAWEADPPSLSSIDDLQFGWLAQLNSFARTLGRFGNGEWTLRKQIYWLKREAIRYATDHGRVFLRLIESRVTCHSCDGTGIYRYWDWRPEDGVASGDPPCRRCSGRGRVTLRFIECNVADRYLFHLPYDHTHPFRTEQIERLQPYPAQMWRPDTKGRAMPISDALFMIGQLKFRYWALQPRYVHEIYTFMNEEVDGRELSCTTGR